MKTVVSISLGSSLKDKSVEIEFGGELFRLQRIGVNGDLKRAQDLIAHYDGKVDAIGIGGVDRYLVAGGRRYEVADAARMARCATRTPVVDGGGVKRVLEPMLLRRLVEDGQLLVEGKRVLLMSGVDRPGMAALFPELGARVIYGDLAFAVGIPIALTSVRQLSIVGRLLLPFLTRLPMSALYPCGRAQDSSSPRFPGYFEDADIIAGDFIFMRRYMPSSILGKVVITNTTRHADVEMLRERGAAKLITVTPSMAGESFGTNVMEGVLVALSGKRPADLTDEDYLCLAERINWKLGYHEFADARHTVVTESKGPLVFSR